MWAPLLSSYSHWVEPSSLSPHIFQLANNAYYYMHHRVQDQSLIIRYILFFIWYSVWILIFSIVVKLAMEGWKVTMLPSRYSWSCPCPIQERGMVKLWVSFPSRICHPHMLFNSNASCIGKYTGLQVIPISFTTWWLMHLQKNVRKCEDFEPPSIDHLPEVHWYSFNTTKSTLLSTLTLGLLSHLQWIRQLYYCCLDAEQEILCQKW